MMTAASFCTPLHYYDYVVVVILLSFMLAHPYITESFTAPQYYHSHKSHQQRLKNIITTHLHASSSPSKKEKKVDKYGNVKRSQEELLLDLETKLGLGYEGRIPSKMQSDDEHETSEDGDCKDALATSASIPHRCALLTILG